MANVSFNSDEARLGFQGAHNDPSLRTLVIGIEDEKFVVKGSSQGSPSGVAADFDGLVQSAGLSPSSGAFVLFDMSDGEKAVDEGSRQWLFISWVPDLCRPREKMLYSSSRESLKRSLGAGHFAAGDYYCNCEGDVQWAAFQRWSTSEEGAPLSELEVLKREEAAMEKDTSVKSNAMGAIAFQMIPGAREALNELAASDPMEDRVLAITLQDEKVGVCPRPSASEVAAVVAGTAKLSTLVPSTDQPAYLFLKLPSLPALATGTVASPRSPGLDSFMSGHAGMAALWVTGWHQSYHPPPSVLGVCLLLSGLGADQASDGLQHGQGDCALRSGGFRAANRTRPGGPLSRGSRCPRGAFESARDPKPPRSAIDDARAPAGEGEAKELSQKEVRRRRRVARAVPSEGGFSRRGHSRFKILHGSAGAYSRLFEVNKALQTGLWARVFSKEGVCFQ